MLTCVCRQPAPQPQEGPTLGLMLCRHHREILNQLGPVDILKAPDPRGFTRRDTGELLGQMTKDLGNLKQVQILYLGCRGLKERK